MGLLDIKNLCVSLDGKKLLTDINMSVERGARHLLAGHNGSGKSTLVGAITGNPAYTIDSGEIIFDEKNITNENATTRSLMGIFVGAQNVPEIPGLTVLSFLKHSMAAHTHFRTHQDLPMGQFLQDLESAREHLNIPRDWLNRSVNVGFSVDEPDSGADADVQKQIATTIRAMTDTTFIFISHQPNFTDTISPTSITTLSGGKIMLQ